MSGSGLDQSIMIQRMNLQAPQLQYGHGGAEDDGVDEALLKSDPEQKEKRDANVRDDIREMKRLIEKQRSWLRQILLIESENLPKRSMIEFEKQRRWCRWCRKEKNDTTFETYVKTRVECLRLLCRDQQESGSGGGVGTGGGGGNDGNGSSSEKKKKGKVVSSSKEASHHKLFPDSNLFRIAMIEMYKVLALRSDIDGGGSGALASMVWPDSSGNSELRNNLNKNVEKDLDELDYVKESKEFMSGREGFRDRYTSGDY
jgi:hypothetical protein